MTVRAVVVAESSQVGEARRVCMDAAVAAGFAPPAAGRAALVATELANNILRHASAGEILVGPWRDPTGAGLDVLAIDRGPGMADIATCLRDGFSTAGTPGTGLGAVRRQAENFAVHSAPGAGTAILARLTERTPRPADTPKPPWGAVAVPCRGETACGDAWAAVAENGVASFLVADGLGHGIDAAAAAEEARHRFLQAPFRAPADILEAIHLALRPTRGAAVAITRLEPANGRALFAGLGNIGAGLAQGAELRRMVSHNGTAGHQARRIQQFEYPCPPGSLLIMHSDGLSSSWWPPRQPGFAALHPTLAAALLYRDHGRRRDDCCVLVARATP